MEPHLPVCQQCRWQLGPNMWSSPTTKSFDPIVATALQMDFPGESHGPATCGFACNCPEPEAWTTEASGRNNNINDNNNNNASTYLDHSMLVVISGLLLWETFHKFVSHFLEFHYDCLIYSLYAYRATLFVVWNYNNYWQYTAVYVLGTMKSM